MCGIAGYKTGQIVSESVLDRMLEALEHRGPDSKGLYNSGEFCAGIRRLSINDLETGDQPLFNGDGSVILFYNGEIYNSPQLRRELEAKGYRFRTHSDGEVICHLYDQCGESLFEKLDGMFAIALWVEREKKLLLARDIPGEKPLYYSFLKEGGVVFASELKSLCLFPGVDRSLDLQALWDFPTFLWIPEPSTVYKSVKALLPGHILIADQSGVQIRSYPNRFNQDQINLSEREWICETRRVVDDAVASRLLSDVPVGAFLSSGLDSSIVATVASQHLDRLSTFTIGFEALPDPYHGGVADETVYAEAYARQLGANHHTIRVTSDLFKDNLHTFCRHGDQPFAVSSGLGILSIAREAHNAGIKVLLSGDGADECFGGYWWYPYLNGSDSEGGSIPGDTVFNPRVSFQNFGIELKDRLKILNTYPPQIRAWAWHYYASESEKKSLFAPSLCNQVKPSTRFFYEHKASVRWEPIDFITNDRKLYFPNEMLKKVDRMAMAYSVEGRVPFAAPSVLSHAGKIKYPLMVKEGSVKWILRKAYEDLLPKDVLNRPKHGFNVPIDIWLKSEWRDLLDRTFSEESALSKYHLIRHDSCKVASAMLNDPERLNGHSLFAYIMLNLWLEEGNHGNNS